MPDSRLRLLSWADADKLLIGALAARDELDYLRALFMIEKDDKTLVWPCVKGLSSMRKTA